MDLNFYYILLLLFVGVLMGFINTLAGGGSNLSLPALMLLGLPPDIANGTNRVAVALQCFSGVMSFKHHNKLETNDIVGLTIPTVIGGVLGALIASFAPELVLKPLLLLTMLTMSLIILVRPTTVMPPPGTVPYKIKERPVAWFGMLFAGLYGGFVHAGVGFVLIGALSGLLRYDLVRANAIKLLTSLFFTLVALSVFILRDQVWWIPGLILSLGSIAGALLSVKFAISASPATLKWFLFAMTLCACVAALFFS